MMSSIPWRSSVPGASRSIAPSSRGSRRGSSSDGDRVKPRVLCLSVFSVNPTPSRSPDPSSVVQARPDRVSQRLVTGRFEFAMRRSSGRSENADAPELRALLEPAPGLGRRAEASGEADLAEGGEPAADGDPFRGGGDGERDGEVGARLVDSQASGDVHEDVRAPE